MVVGNNDGDTVVGFEDTGWFEGIRVGIVDGTNIGNREGICVGFADGLIDGLLVGRELGNTEGKVVVGS